MKHVPKFVNKAISDGIVPTKALLDKDKVTAELQELEEEYANSKSVGRSTKLTQAGQQSNLGWDCAYQVVGINAQRG